jgi:SAM-dependent methyltransferase
MKLNSRVFWARHKPIVAAVATATILVALARSENTFMRQSFRRIMHAGDASDILQPGKVFVPQDNTEYYAASFQKEACGPDNCNNQGQCFLGKCFCFVGADGENCELGKVRNCSVIPALAKRLECFRHEEYGVATVDRTTWANALKSEAAVWSGVRASDDRAREHAEGYDEFKILGDKVEFGHYAEFGCGPWTQTTTCVMKTLNWRGIPMHFESVTLLEPNMRNYMAEVPTCSYKSGELIPGVPTYLVAAGAEVKLFHNRFDTLLMSNVLEHVQNAYEILQNVHDALKPGGLLIFHDRWWPDFEFATAVPQDNLFHPVRLQRPVFDWFNSKFEVLYENYEGTTAMKQRGDTGLYLIARKPL